MMTLKEKQFLVMMIKELIKDDAKNIMDAYEEEYAPAFDGNREPLDRSKVNLGQLLDMAACLMYEWYGDPDFDEIEDYFKI